MLFIRIFKYPSEKKPKRQLTQALIFLLILQGRPLDEAGT
jgi:hypothetical protein